MTEYLYHGSPVKLTELKEPYEGRGVYLTPSRALAGMFGVMYKQASSYEDALSVYNSLPPESQQYLSHHDTYVDPKDNLLYRVVKKNKTGLPLGFMDVYKHDGSKDNGFVVVGVRPEYQGKGIGSGLLQKAIEKAEARNMDNLVWGCMNFNEPSKKLALSVGGKKYKDIGDYELYNIPVKKKLSKEGIHKAAQLKRTLRSIYD